MPTQLTGTVVDAGIELDQPVELPNNTRVSIMVNPVPPAPRPDTGWPAWKRRIQRRPIHAAGLHFSRDELHENDETVYDNAESSTEL